MLQKQNVNINFAQGLDLKTDPKQIPIGKFSALQNAIFTKGGLLQKRNGFGELTSLPNNEFSYLTTLNGSLTAIGDSIAAYSSADTWVSKGNLEPLQLSTLSLVKNNLNQIQADSVIASNGLICTAYTEINNSTLDFKYVISDSITGQNIIAPTLLVGANATYGTPRVFLLENYFIIAYTTHPSAYAISYIAISTSNPSYATTPAYITTSYVPKLTLSWDGVVANNTLYVGFNSTAGGQAIKVTSLSAQLAAAGSPAVTPKAYTGQIATIMSLCVDSYISQSPIIYVNYYDAVSSTGYSLAIDQNLNPILSPTEVISSGTVLNLSTAASNSLCTIFSEVSETYSYDSGIPTNYINCATVTSAGTVTGVGVIIRSMGLASKSFMVNGSIYFLSAYQSPYQSTYFLINGSLSRAASPIIVAKLAYSNGGGYCPNGLPNITINDSNTVSFPYLYKDLIQPVNKTTAVVTGTQINGVYTQTGINLGSITFGTQGIDTSEIAGNLHISGGFLWQYDGYLPVEHNFFLWPDSVETTPATSGGLMIDQVYYYQATYEWSDNQGNIYRSAPSIPVIATVSGGGGDGSVTIDVPTLRATLKTTNPVKIVLYRWSAAQQVYYQVTSVVAPTLNDTTADSVAIVDTLADTAIIGNNILYTTGGVVEDINAPASNILTLFDTRLWLVDAEDPNLLWFSKQVIENVPVEMSDLFTFYVAPTTAAQGSTGNITALAPMDDKLIIFKNNAIYYINGTGPDNTGANNNYSQPIFITSTVGCTNQQSIVLMQSGLMFQSDKGIWLLGRDLSTSYIGAPVENYNSSNVLSALNVPAENQIRFTLDTGQVLMYDYYYQQWGTFNGVPGISSCVFEGLHTFINSLGQVLQETPNEYLDGTNPVLLSFTTGWLNMVGLQGYQRAYFIYILGQYMSPHLLQVLIAYDYNSAVTQVSMIEPDNYSPPFGVASPFGQGSFGGNPDLENWRIFLKQQRCQAFQLTINELYDPSFGVPAGEGLTLSGLNIVYGAKKNFRPMPAKYSVG